MNEEKQKPVNDDPRRLHEDNVECYTACDDIEGEDSDFEDEDVALTLLASMSMFETTIEGKNPEEVKHEFVKFYRRMRFAEGILDRHLLEKEAESTKPKITGTFAEQVAIHMAANIWATYTERLDDKNVWNKDVFDRFNERLKVMVIDWLTSCPTNTKISKTCCEICDSMGRRANGRITAVKCWKPCLTKSSATF